MKILYALLVSYCVWHTAYCADFLPVTVWVHGTHIGPKFFMHDFFYRKMGMVNMLDYKPCYHSREMAQSICTADPLNYQMEHFYFWGWSGKLSRTARKNEARQLYFDLLQLIAQYQQQYPTKKVFIRLISHSHGGNLLLNLARVQDADNQLIFDELILLSCPVQHATKELVTSDRFKKIYSFYSSDLYQVIDLQRIEMNGITLRRFSERRFTEVPALHQAKIKINGRAIFHIEFMLDRFLRNIPLLCSELDLFYNSLDAAQQKKEKLLHIQYCPHTTTVRKKLL